jgi:hypothetical protein
MDKKDPVPFSKDPAFTPYLEPYLSNQQLPILFI